MNTLRIEQIKNNLLPTALVDKTIRPTVRADKSSDHNKRQSTDTIDHGLTKMIINGHERDMDTKKFTSSDQANVEICKLGNDILRRAKEKRGRSFQILERKQNKIPKEWMNFLH